MSREEEAPVARGLTLDQTEDAGTRGGEGPAGGVGERDEGAAEHMAVGVGARGEAAATHVAGDVGARGEAAAAQTQAVDIGGRHDAGAAQGGAAVARYVEQPADSQASLAVVFQAPVMPVAGRDGRHGHHESTNCANCGAAVSGNFCANCGQRREHEMHSLWHFTQEATEDLTHADSRLWSTMIALLFKPGFLTTEFLAGRRVRYLPPLRLYLVLSVVFFLILGTGVHESKAISFQTKGGRTSMSVVKPNDVEGLAPRPGETSEERAARVCNPEYDGPLRKFIVPFVTKGCRKTLADNGHTVFEAMLHNLPRAMFLFLPALAVVMKLMYWRPRRYYVEHLLFFVHNHAFVFALFGVYTLLSRLVSKDIDDWLQLLVWGYTAWYVFVSMRRVYGQGRFMTFMKYTALSFTYLFGAVFTLVATVTYSVYWL